MLPLAGPKPAFQMALTDSRFGFSNRDSNPNLSRGVSTQGLHPKASRLDPTHRRPVLDIKRGDNNGDNDEGNGGNRHDDDGSGSGSDDTSASSDSSDSEDDGNRSVDYGNRSDDEGNRDYNGNQSGNGGNVDYFDDDAEDIYVNPDHVNPNMGK